LNLEVRDVSEVRAQPDAALAALLKRLRKEREITQEQLAFDAGITASALSRIERGLNDPGWTTVTRIANALGISLVDLVIHIERDSA
jgi:transcriptional regulator with XRE-family HTH domain